MQFIILKVLSMICSMLCAWINTIACMIATVGDHCDHSVLVQYTMACRHQIAWPEHFMNTWWWHESSAHMWTIWGWNRGVQIPDVWFLRVFSLMSDVFRPIISDVWFFKAYHLWCLTLGLSDVWFFRGQMSDVWFFRGLVSDVWCWCCFVQSKVFFKVKLAKN